MFVGAVAIKGNEQERLAQDEMHHADERRKSPKHFQTSSGLTSRMLPTSMFLISSSPSAARLRSKHGRRRRHDVAMPMTASCGIWLVRLPVTEKIAAPSKVNPSAIANVRPAVQVQVQEDGDADA